jgi:hypothetical protein
MSRMEDSGRNHAVWMDNLFTSTKLLETLLEMGIGGAGTVRTSPTHREMMEKKDSSDIQLQVVRLDNVCTQASNSS